MTTSHTIEDPSEDAIYLAGIFERMGVPCLVTFSSDKGKRVEALRDIASDSELFNENPIVSWPVKSYLDLDTPFCTHCLRDLRNENTTTEKEESEEAKENTIEWSSCRSCRSFFCSADCRKAMSGSHHILCNVFEELRRNSCENAITKESLARCVAWMTARMVKILETHKLSAGEIAKEHASRKGDALSRQLFFLAIAPFNRLIDAPNGSKFADVDADEWCRDVARLLREPCYRILMRTANAFNTTTTNNNNNINSYSDSNSTPDDGAWAHEIVEALLRRDTLETLLAQLSLNSQAINGFILGSFPQSVGSSSERPATVPPISWVLKGGGVYTLQSAFNHSCRPNVSVSAVHGTHEISLRTIRPIQRGEELTITYIPLENTTVGERREKLRSYFFTCHCPRCQEEEEKEEKIKK